MIKRIVTHPGKAHLDELIAIAFALAIGFPPGSLMLPMVFRREPTPEDLQDPEVLVLDVGGELDPARNNFDHHQREVDEEPKCAAHLWLEYNAPGVLTDLSVHAPWFRAMNAIDVRGPYAWATDNGFARFPFELGGALEAPVKAMFEAFAGETPVAKQLVELLWRVGQDHLAHLQEVKDALGVIDASAELVGVEGVPGVIYLSKEVDALNSWREAKRQEGIDVAFSVTLDDREAGFALYRFQDDPRIDFTRIKGRQGVKFSHKGGFIAKVAPMEVIEALGLVGEAVIKKGE
jgi:hypothetical protein